METLADASKKTKKAMTLATNKRFSIPRIKEYLHQEWDKVSQDMTAALEATTTTSIATTIETTDPDTEIAGSNQNHPQMVVTIGTQTGMSTADIEALESLNEQFHRDISWMDRRMNEINLDKLRAEERARQHEFQLVKCCKEAEYMTAQHDRHIAALTEQMRKMDLYGSPINDDEASRTMKKLQSDVDVWVKANFNIFGRIDALVNDWCNDGRLPWAVYKAGDDYKNQALIRTIVAHYINDCVFSEIVLGPNPDTDNFIGKVAERLEESQGELARQWRSLTSLVWQHAFPEELQTIPTRVAELIDTSLNEYSETETQKRQRQLRKIIAECVKFKKRLERQEIRYGFYICHPGVSYVPDNMYTVTDAQNIKGFVDFCIFPGLWKMNQQREYSAVQKACVWTRRVEEAEMGAINNHHQRDTVQFYSASMSSYPAYMSSDSLPASSSGTQTPTQQEYDDTHDTHEAEWTDAEDVNSNLQRDMDSESMENTAESGLDMKQSFQGCEMGKID